MEGDEDSAGRRILDPNHQHVEISRKSALVFYRKMLQNRSLSPSPALEKHYFEFLSRSPKWQVMVSEYTEQRREVMELRRSRLEAWTRKRAKPSAKLEPVPHQGGATSTLSSPAMMTSTTTAVRVSIGSAVDLSDADGEMIAGPGDQSLVQTTAPALSDAHDFSGSDKSGTGSGSGVVKTNRSLRGCSVGYVLYMLRVEERLSDIEKDNVYLRDMVPKSLDTVLRNICYDDGRRSRFRSCMELVECLWLNAGERHRVVAGDDYEALEIIDRINERTRLATAYLKSITEIVYTRKSCIGGVGGTLGKGIEQHGRAVGAVKNRHRLQAWKPAWLQQLADEHPNIPADYAERPLDAKPEETLGGYLERIYVTSGKTRKRKQPSA